MTVLGLKLSARARAVSVLHGDYSGVLPCVACHFLLKLPAEMHAPAFACTSLHVRIGRNELCLLHPAK